MPLPRRLPRTYADPVFTVTESVDIDRPAADVFAFLTDGANRPRWDSTVVSETLTSPAPVQVGTTLRTRMRALGREVAFDWRVTEHVAGRRMAVESTSGIIATSSVLTFADRMPAGTRVTVHIEASPSGIMRLAEPMIAESVRTTLGTSLARAKRLLEDETG